MQDSIIKGTGNSRYLKSIAAFLTQYPTYADFAAALAAGTLPVELNGINEEGFQQLGTALNKENLLQDNTAAIYGLGTDAVPDDVFAWLGKYNQYWWKQRVYVESSGYEEKQTAASDSIYLQYTSSTTTSSRRTSSSPRPTTTSSSSTSALPMPMRTSWKGAWAARGSTRPRSFWRSGKRTPAATFTPSAALCRTFFRADIAGLPVDACVPILTSDIGTSTY